MDIRENFNFQMMMYMREFVLLHFPINSLVKEFVRDLVTIANKGTRIYIANGQLHNLFNVESHVKQSFYARFESLLNASRTFNERIGQICQITHIGQIFQITPDRRQQIRLLIPELLEINDQADNLLADVANC
jgi:hypothetical protein